MQRGFCEQGQISRRKKELSLTRDRRNAYGENPAASRKGIRRGKQRSHMGERRAVSQILSGLRERADEGEAIEADVLTKTTIVESKHSAFKKMPDVPFSIVVKRKLARREELTRSETRDTAPVWPNISSEEIFDTPYIRVLHKRPILFHLRYRINARSWGANKKKSQLVRAHDRKEAARWEKAILRDAPLLKGFFCRGTTMARQDAALVQESFE